MNRHLLLLACFAFVFHVCSPQSVTQQAFIQNQLVPDILDIAPAEQLQVRYGNEEVNLGNELTPTNVRQHPQVLYQADTSEFFTLLMVDPDAPSRANPIRREVRHWLVMNIPGSNICQGDVISAYIGSGPPQGSGLHRYVFLLFRQPGRLDVSQIERQNKRQLPGRINFSTRKFIETQRLGVPIAGNFYQAQFDDSVLQLQKQLGLTA